MNLQKQDVYISAWGGDDLGSSGTITIEDYTNEHTWTHTWCKWTYFFPLPHGMGFVFPELWVDLYVGSIGGGGGSNPIDCIW